MKRKKLGKFTLESMENSFQPLEEELLKRITGGDGYVSSYNINGGTITNWSYSGENYAVFTSNDGKTLVLEGVHVGGNTLPGQYSNTACYAFGEIRIGSNWASFSFNNLTHEYGHYLQEQSMGSLSYAISVAGSVISIATGGVGHSERPFEQGATSMGNSYASSYYDYPKSY